MKKAVGILMAAGLLAFAPVGAAFAQDAVAGDEITIEESMQYGEDAMVADEAVEETADEFPGEEPVTLEEIADDDSVGTDATDAEAVEGEEGAEQADPEIDEAPVEY